MKRRIAKGLAGAVAAALLAACSNGTRPAGTPRGQTDGWVRPPAIRAFERTGGALVFHGQAEPGSRVVLRSGDRAYAAAADAEGQFDIRMAAPVGHMLLQPETQVGQDAAPSPEQLLIVDGGQGPVALLRPGGATRRLDRSPALAAVDSDGRAMLASGPATAGRPPAPLRLGGGEAVRASIEGGARWTAMLGSSPGGPATVTVGEESFVWPGETPRGSSLSVERAGEGWRVGWPGPGNVWQTTWLPAAGG